MTDPPYLVDYTGRWNSDWGRIEGDDDPAWVEPVFRELWRILKPDSLLVSFYGWPHADVFLGTWKAIGFRPISHLSFVKNQMGLGYYTRGKHEVAYLLAKGRPKRPERAVPDVFPFTRVHKALHPNEKPRDAIDPLVSMVSRPGDVVLDPFCGVGTVGESCIAQGRSFIGVELSPKYAALARTRLLAATPLAA